MTRHTLQDTIRRTADDINILVSVAADHPNCDLRDLQNSISQRRAELRSLKKRLRTLDAHGVQDTRDLTL